jgi:hypothetical protein
MRRLALLALAGCSAPPAAKPSPVRPQPAPVTVTPAAPASTATPTAPPIASASARILVRLPIRAGKIPGAPYEVTTLATTSYCGGVSVGVAPVASRIADDDLPLDIDADDFRRVLTLQMPMLDNLGDGRDEGLRVANRLGSWTKQALHDFGDLHFALRAHLSHAKTLDDELATLARLVVIERRFAEVFARAPIPAPFADEPARSGWCDSLAAKVEGLVDAADADAATCRDVSTKAHVAGWWTTVCATASPATPGTR